MQPAPGPEPEDARSQHHLDPGQQAQNPACFETLSTEPLAQQGATRPVALPPGDHDRLEDVLHLRRQWCLHGVTAGLAQDFHGHPVHHQVRPEQPHPVPPTPEHRQEAGFVPPREAQQGSACDGPDRTPERQGRGRL
jgi:hypothetical protein